MEKVRWAVVVMLFAIPALAQQPPQPKEYPGEGQKRIEILKGQRDGNADAIVVLDARVWALTEENKRLEAEAKVLREKCADACKEPEKK